MQQHLDGGRAGQRGGGHIGFARDCKIYASVVVFIWSRSLKNAQEKKYSLAAGFSFIWTLNLSFFVIIIIIFFPPN